VETYQGLVVNPYEGELSETRRGKKEIKRMTWFISLPQQLESTRLDLYIDQGEVMASSGRAAQGLLTSITTRVNSSSRSIKVSQLQPLLSL